MEIKEKVWSISGLCWRGISQPQIFSHLLEFIFKLNTLEKKSKLMKTAPTNFYHFFILFKKHLNITILLEYIE